MSIHICIDDPEDLSVWIRVTGSESSPANIFVVKEQVMSMYKEALGYRQGILADAEAVKEETPASE